jgi:hypothetical protein
MGIELIQEKYKSSILCIIQQKVQNNQISLEIMKDVFDKVELSMDAIIYVNNFDDWIYELTNNSICDYYLKRSMTN